MPVAAVVQSANLALTQEAVRSLHAEQSGLIDELSRPGSLGAVAQSHLGLSDEDRRYIEAIPNAVQESLRSAVHTAVASGKAVHLTFRPAYDFGVSVWEFGDAVGVQLTGPYTGAAFPRESFNG
jgi:hypothetical protein